MPSYRVTWEIDIDADSAKEAAQKALTIQRNADSIATVFRLVDRDNAWFATTVDMTLDRVDYESI